MKKKIGLICYWTLAPSLCSKQRKANPLVELCSTSIDSLIVVGLVVLSASILSLFFIDVLVRKTIGDKSKESRAEAEVGIVVEDFSFLLVEQNHKK